MTKKQTITPEQLRPAILAVLDYLWHEERQHFLLRPTPDQANHIFAALTVLAQRLGDTDHSASYRSPGPSADLRSPGATGSGGGS